MKIVHIDEGNTDRFTAGELRTNTMYQIVDGRRCVGVIAYTRGSSLFAVDGGTFLCHCDDLTGRSLLLRKLAPGARVTLEQE